MLPAAEMDEMQATEALTMVDTCTIAAMGDTDFVDGAYVETPGASLYTGACQVQVTDSIGTEGENVGEQLVVTEKVTVKIPVSAPAIPINSVVTITAVADVSDSTLVDRQYRVTGTHAKTYATSRRLPCEQVTA